MQTQEIFKRYEKKYLLEEGQFHRTILELTAKMTPDQYGRHTICNIYFDTPDYQLIRSSLEKPVYKEKLRLRSYGVPAEEDTVYIELKKKFDGIVYKRRTPMKLSEAEAYLLKGEEPSQDNQIIREIDYVKNYYGLQPAVYLAYDRVALFGNENPDLRVTFDFNIRGRGAGLDLKKGAYGKSIMKKGQVLMEVKIPGAMPVWMSRCFAQLGIYPVSFSKYGEYYRQNIEPVVFGSRDYLKEKEEVKGGSNCA